MITFQRGYCVVALITLGGMSTGPVKAVYGQTCVAPMAAPDGPRYIGITVTMQSSDPVAILLTGDESEMPCGNKYVDFEPASELAALGIGRLLDFPVFRPASEWGTVHVRGRQIIPGHTYDVYVNCGTSEVPVWSEHASVTTRVWGDVAGPFDGAAWGPPDGVVTITADAVASVDAFRGLATAPAIQCVDLDPGTPDCIVSIMDIVMVVDAFKGIQCRHDCNANGIFDACDLEMGSSDDCDGNNVPDECDPDCDGDGIPDACDTMDDVDEDGVGDCFDLCPYTNPEDRPCICPDLIRCCWPTGLCIPDYPRDACILQGGTPDCNPVPCLNGCLLGDFDADGDVDMSDFDTFASCFSGPGGGLGVGCRMGDFDADEDIDCDDWSEFSGLAWTEETPPPVLPECEP